MAATPTTAALRGLLPPTVVGRILARVRASRLLGGGVAAALGAGVALISSVPLPRGPLEAPEAFAVIATSFLVGLASGSLLRSRWALVIAPLGYLAAYELARVGIAGAAFGPIRLDTPYGIVALVAGRGVHGLLAIVPMVAGAAVALATRRPRRRRSALPAGVLAATTVALAVIVAIPGSVPPSSGATGPRSPA